jgi:hypothetical protein
MLGKLPIACALALGGAMLVAQPAAAAPMTQVPQTLTGEALVEQVQWRYCRRWHRECRFRWGYGWRYRRCMRRHGC